MEIHKAINEARDWQRAKFLLFSILAIYCSQFSNEINNDALWNGESLSTSTPEFTDYILSQFCMNVNLKFKVKNYWVKLMFKVKWLHLKLWQIQQRNSYKTLKCTKLFDGITFHWNTMKLFIYAKVKILMQTLFSEFKITFLLFLQIRV